MIYQIETRLCCEKRDRGYLELRKENWHLLENPRQRSRMECWWTRSRLAIGIILLAQTLAAQDLSCINNQFFEVAENNEENQIKCSNLGNQPGTLSVNWKAGQSNDLVGECPPLLAGQTTDSCKNKAFTGIYNPVRTSNNFSVMSINGTYRKGPTPTVFITNVTCQAQIGNQSEATEKSCMIDYVYPAKLGNCSVQFTRWKVLGDCSIDKYYSARNRFTCQWYQMEDGSSPGTAFGESTMITLSSTEGKYKSAKCNLTGSLPAQPGSYTYSVLVYPGGSTKEAQLIGAFTNTIALPAKPTTTCSPSGYVTENTNISCTCRTQSVGSPTGNLWWRKGMDNKINVNLSRGNYSDTMLQVIQRIVRADHNKTKFRCDVQWNNKQFSSDLKTVMVGYKPERLSIKLNSSSQTEVTVKENNKVPFTCEADGRPAASMTVVRKGGTEKRSGQSPLIFTLTASCADTGTYLCSASNGIGQVDTSANIYVECKPRFHQGERALELNYRNQFDRRDFNAIAYPALNASFSQFKYLGPDGTDHPSEIRNINLTTTCQQKSYTLYISICTLTVHDMTSPAAEGFYTVTLSNTEGSYDVRFKVLYNASDGAAVAGNGAVIGGSVAAIIVIAIVVIVIVCLMKRRKAGKTRNSPGRNSYREMDELGLANADPEAPSSPLSFAPMALNAEVDRKKKNSKAAAAQEANGGRPADVYAQVDKTKKSNQRASAPEAEAYGEQPADVYAVVEKTNKKQALGAGAKPKTGAKATGKPKKEKKKKDKRDEAAHLYGNVEEVKRGKGAKVKKTTIPPKEETSSGKVVNPEGLIYTSVEFSQPPKYGKPPSKKPEEEAVVYSAVDFKKSPPAP